MFFDWDSEDFKVPVFILCSMLNCWIIEKMSAMNEEDFHGFIDEEVVPVLTVVDSQKGKQMLSINGYLYNINKEVIIRI